jgi:hypothetical protein
MYPYGCPVCATRYCPFERFKAVGQSALVLIQGSNRQPLSLWKIPSSLSRTPIGRERLTLRSDRETLPTTIGLFGGSNTRHSITSTSGSALINLDTAASVSCTHCSTKTRRFLSAGRSRSQDGHLAYHSRVDQLYTLLSRSPSLLTSPRRKASAFSIKHLKFVDAVSYPQSLEQSPHLFALTQVLRPMA